MPPSSEQSEITSPILVLGLARSGTTWLGKIFDSHPDTTYRHEPDRDEALPGLPRIVMEAQTWLTQSTIRKFADGLPELQRVDQAASLPVFRKRSESWFGFRRRTVETWAARLAGRRLVNFRLPDFCLGPQFAHRRLVWKSVGSVGRTSAIIEALPLTHVVFIIRHPCGVIHSRARGVRARLMKPISRSEFNELLSLPLHSFAGVAAPPSPAAGRFELEAYRWACLNSKALKEIEGNGRCCSVRYEDLCTDPKAVASRLFDRVGLSWDPQVERFIERSTSSDTRRFYSVYRRAESIDAWKDAMPRPDQERVQQLVADSLAGRLYFGPDARTTG